MSGISSAQTPCEIIYHVFLYKNLYGQTVNALRKSREALSQGKLYCLSFYNPLSRVVTPLTGTRIVDICDRPSSIVWCNDEERIAGLVILYSPFFRSILGAFDKALQHRSQLTLYCKAITVPPHLFPSYTGPSTFVIRGKEIIALMCAALGRSGIPSNFID